MEYVSKKWHYVVVNYPFYYEEIFRKVMVINNHLHSLRTKNKFKAQENDCKNYDYCYIEMSKIK